MPLSHARSQPAAPFLKWAGGKSRLLAQYQPYLPHPAQIGRYYEPFLGSAAVFFALQPADACLADQNERLVEVYRVVQQQVEALIDALQGHPNEADYYYQMRARDPRQLTAVERAARLIYLNKTCYNGLYRENSDGRFNVPFGRYKKPTICDAGRLRAAAHALQNVELQVADFADAVATAAAGDFIYFDPPYAPISATSSFTGYYQHGFDEADQRRLADTFYRLAGRGCRLLLSNSNAPLVYELYDGRGYRLIPIQARRNINSKGNGRGPIQELLITNDLVKNR
jgi:DNA adenine methylase